MPASSSKPPLTDLSWTWRSFGGHLMLVTESHGALVVLSGDRNSPILTRGEDGVLRPIREDDPVAQFIATAPLKMRGLQTQLDTVLAIRGGRETQLKKAVDLLVLAQAQMELTADGESLWSQIDAFLKIMRPR